MSRPGAEQCCKQNVWHETAAYDANQFSFQTGTIIGQPGLPRDTFKLLGRDNRLVWSTPVATDGSWQNFALTLDFPNKYLHLAH